MAAGDLTTIEKVREYLGQGDLSGDTVLAGLISSSSAWARSQLGYNPLVTTYTDSLDVTGYGGDRYGAFGYAGYGGYGYGGYGTYVTGRESYVILVSAITPRAAPKPPVTITSVTVDGVLLDPSAYTLVDGRRVRRVEGVFPRGRGNVVVVYASGWTLETLPADLAQAVTEHVALRYRDRGRLGLASQNGGGESATYSNAGTLAYIEGALDAFRPLVVG